MRLKHLTLCAFLASPATAYAGSMNISQITPGAQLVLPQRTKFTASQRQYMGGLQLQAERCWSAHMSASAFTPNAGLPNDLTANLEHQSKPSVGLNILEDEHGTIRAIQPGNLQNHALPAVHLIVHLDKNATITTVSLNKNDQAYLQSGVYRDEVGAAMEALKTCKTFTGLPPEEYETWHEFSVVYGDGLSRD